MPNFIENEKGEILVEKKEICLRLLGGLADDNESLWQTAQRETKEEVNLDIKNLVPFCFQDDPGRIKKVIEMKCFFHTMSFWTKDYSGEIILEEAEIEDVAWVDLKETKHLFRQNAQKVIERFLIWKETKEFQYLTNKKGE
ncbi:MAG: NUDIX hydrolase [Alphaproteobacteria bacterium]|nr:NUDIX hydrolase [Alphaproteobacteria bacterium]